MVDQYGIMALGVYLLVSVAVTMVKAETTCGPDKYFNIWEDKCLSCSKCEPGESLWFKCFDNWDTVCSTHIPSFLQNQERFSDSDKQNSDPGYFNSVDSRMNTGEQQSAMETVDIHISWPDVVGSVVVVIVAMTCVGVVIIRYKHVVRKRKQKWIYHMPGTDNGTEGGQMNSYVPFSMILQHTKVPNNDVTQV